MKFKKSAVFILTSNKFPLTFVLFYFMQGNELFFDVRISKGGKTFYFYEEKKLTLLHHHWKRRRWDGIKLFAF